MTFHLKNLHLLSRSGFINSLADVPKEHTRLDISGNNLGKRSLKALGLALAKTPSHITSIDLSNNQLDIDNIMPIILYYLPNTIKTFDLDHRSYKSKDYQSNHDCEVIKRSYATLETIRFFDFLEIIENTANKYKDNPKHKKAFEAAQTLIQDLNDLKKHMFDHPNIAIAYKGNFKEACIKAIEKSRTVLAAHDDWKAVLADFIHHIIAFCTFGKVQMNHYNFFSNTHSKQKVDEFVSNLDNPVLGVA